jgi:hypothetical protein
MLNAEGLLAPAVTRYRKVMLPGQSADSDGVLQADAVLEQPRLPVDPEPGPELEGVPKRSRSLPWWPAGALVVVLLGASLAVPGMRHQWALSIIRQPTYYTTLSFQDAGHLPTTVAPDSPLHLSFTVANNQGRSLRYRYVVTSASGRAAPKIVGQSSVTVPAGGQRTASVTVKPGCTASPCRVQVALPDHAESIDILLNLGPSAN